MRRTRSTPCARWTIASRGSSARCSATTALSADIIVDGIHVAPAVVKIFLHSKGPERAVLITDAISATGMPDGRYQLGPIEVDVKDGKCTSNGSLAGSVLTMDRAVRNVTKFSEWSLREAVRAATLNAARAVGLARHHGVLATRRRSEFHGAEFVWRSAQDHRARSRLLRSRIEAFRNDVASTVPHEARKRSGLAPEA